MKKVNILVFPCGSEIGLELNRSLKDISFITLYGASSMADHGKYVFENYVEDLPFANAPDFIDKLNLLLEEKQIDYIYPAMDQVIDILAEHHEDLKAELVAPCRDAVSVCRNKARTYKRLEGLEFVPQIYEKPEDIERYPVIIKPQEGYGGKGFRILSSELELRNALSEADEPMVICEYLCGEEYTIDCFTNCNGDLKYVSCRSRGRIRNGISVNSRFQEPDPRIFEIAKEISGRISMRGVWFFQLKKNEAGEYKLLEVATRVAGTMCLERSVGVNLPLLSILDRMGIDVEIRTQFECVEVDRALYNAFHFKTIFCEVYVDFDDTLIVHGRVNTNLMRFLYQCVNKNISIRLITKHEGDLFAELKKYRLSQELFDDIIHITNMQKKCDYIHPNKNALFIDDSFSERKQVQDIWGITVYGTDAIECLIDYKE